MGSTLQRGLSVGQQGRIQDGVGAAVHWVQPDPIGEEGRSQLGEAAAEAVPQHDAGVRRGGDDDIVTHGDS